MTQGTAALMGAIAGFTIFIGLPVARLKGLSRSMQGFLNALATGILVFLLWDILSHAGAPVEEAIKSAGKQGFGSFAVLIAIFAGGVGAGLLFLTYFNGMVMGRLKLREAANPAGAVPPQAIALSIATGLGLHNFSEGLAIGQSAASGAIAFAGVLVIGFALHNITEGFGIAAPMATTARPVSWGFIAMAGLIGGGPTFLGTLLGYVVTAQPVYVLFLALAAGALIYVLNELFAVGRRLAPPKLFAWGVLLGLLAAYGTDLLLVYLGG